MASGYYVYAIMSSDLRLPTGVAGFGGGELFAIPWRDLSVVTSNIDSAQFEPTPARLLIHEGVVEALCKTGPALPVRFGTILVDRDAVVEAVSERYGSLLADMECLGDKIELGLVALWPSVGSADGEHGEVQGAPALSANTQKGAGTRYLMAKVVEHHNEVSLRNKAVSLAQSIDCLLRRHAIGNRITVMPTSRIVVKAAYLLAPCQLTAFYTAFDELRVAFPDLRFLLNGPWPPYSFVTPPSSLLGGALEGTGESLLAIAASQLLGSTISVNGDDVMRNQDKLEQIR